MKINFSNKILKHLDFKVFKCLFVFKKEKYLVLNNSKIA